DSLRRFDVAYEYKIKENEVGHAFDGIFSMCLDNSVKLVKIRDPYIVNPRQ
ncbi:hypothetical protein AAVH_24910, partial [Aphelenchoides avenae]